jgi:hypothetical protein
LWVAFSIPSGSLSLVKYPVYIQGVSEVRALVLAGDGTRQDEQIFSLPFWRKMLRNGLKKIGKIFLKPFISPKLSYLKT